MKQKKQLAFLLALVVIAAGVWLWSYRRGPSGPGDPPLVAKNQAQGVENPHLRLELIEQARKTEYKSSGRNIFSEVAQPAQRGTTVAKADPVMPVNPACGRYGPCPEPPPPACKLPTNVKFFGYGVVPNGTSRRAFLTDGEGAVHVVSEGEVLMNRFRILRIGNGNLEFEEVSSKCTIGTAPLEEQAGTPPGGPSG